VKTIKKRTITPVWKEGDIAMENKKRIYNDDVFEIGGLLYESLDAYYREAIEYPQNLFTQDSEVYLISEDEAGDITVWTRLKWCDECNAESLIEATLKEEERCECTAEWFIHYELKNMVWLV